MVILSCYHPWLITGFITRVTRRVPLEEFIPVCSGVHVICSLVYCVVFVDHCLSFFFGQCVVCPSIYGFWLPWAFRTHSGIVIPPIITDMLQMQSFEHLFIYDSFPFKHGEFYGYIFEVNHSLIVAVSSLDLSFSICIISQYTNILLLSSGCIQAVFM